MTGSEESRREGRELVLELVFRPVSNLLVPLLARLRIAPPTVVLANGAVGLVGALALSRGELLAAAVLLQVKTLLDNCDGQLARITGRVSLVGRYLDTEADVIVNAAIFVALGQVTEQTALAAAAFVALTLVLAVDFNATESYREAQGIQQTLPLATGSRLERALARIYELVFAPLDRAARWFSTRVELDWLTVTALANLGLSTQLAVLGLCLALDAPEAYLWVPPACLLLVALLQLRLEGRARAAL